MNLPLLWANSLANAAGHLLYPLLSLALVPLYLRYLGLEGYGLIGFLTMLVTLLGVFTKGLGTALQREFARGGEGGTGRQVLNTFERFYVGLAAIVTAAAALSAEWLARNWVMVEAIDPAVVKWCLWLVSVRLGLAFPGTVYHAALLGRQRQVLFNMLSAGTAISAAVAAVFVVVRWRSIVGLYATDVAVHAMSLVFMRRYAVRTLPAGRIGSSVHSSHLRRLAGLSMSLIWTNGIALVLAQLDRVVISRVLPISALGIYTAGAAGGRLLALCYLPFLTAVYPQTCALAETGGTARLGEHLLQTSRIVAVISLVCGLPLVFFSQEFLQVWTRSGEVARGGATVMSLYVIAQLCLAQAAPLWQIQVAAGETKYAAIFNTLAAAWFPPTLWYLISSQGLEGAASAWILYCALAWAYHVWVTASVVPHDRWLPRYAGFNLGAIVAGVGTTAAARYVADTCCHGTPGARIAIAAASGLITLMLTWLIAFGLTLPRQLARAPGQAPPT